MLREIVHVQQRPNEAHRRWFHGADSDLYLWADSSGTAIAFEFCYRQGRDALAVAWKAERGLLHFRVDDGESAVLAKASPLMIPARAGDLAAARAALRDTAGDMPADVIDFVLGKLVR